MPGQSSGLRVSRLWLILVVVALGASAIYWRTGRGPRHVSRQDDSALAKETDPDRYVAARVGREDPNSVKELIEAYGKWAPRADTLEARKAALKTLLQQPNVKIAVESVMKAVEEDPTPRQMDPMYPYLTQGLASLWDAVTFQFGRDRMFIETRDKPRDLLISSMAEVAEKQSAKLGAEQKTMLASDFIDMYPRLKPEQKPEVDRALTALAGTDIVDILNGRQGDHLKVVSQQKQAIDQVLGGARK
jgi:hypothetical protein